MFNQQRNKYYKFCGNPASINISSSIEYCTTSKTDSLTTRDYEEYITTSQDRQTNIMVELENEESVTYGEKSWDATKTEYSIYDYSESNGDLPVGIQVKPISKVYEGAGYSMFFISREDVGNVPGFITKDNKPCFVEIQVTMKTLPFLKHTELKLDFVK